MTKNTLQHKKGIYSLYYKPEPIKRICLQCLLEFYPNNITQRTCCKKPETPEKKINRWKILERDNFKCRTCGRTPNDGIKLHIDHWTPKSKKGSNTEENLITMCNECNLSKSSQKPKTENIFHSI